MTLGHALLLMLAAAATGGWGAHAYLSRYALADDESALSRKVEAIEKQQAWLVGTLQALAIREGVQPAPLPPMYQP